MFNNINEIIDAVAARTEYELLHKVKRGEIPTDQEFAAARALASGQVPIYQKELNDELERAKSREKQKRELSHVELGADVRNEVEQHRNGKEKR